MGNYMNQEVEAQIRNMELRTALEPYYDEAISRLKFSRLKREDDYLESMLEWEIVKPTPIAQWFEPELCPPRTVDKISDQDIHDYLIYLLGKLKEKRIILRFSDHMSDRELYILVLRDVLPAKEKYLQTYIGDREWDCIDIAENEMTYLKYYASREERQIWEDYYGETLPPSEKPKHKRYA